MVGWMVGVRALVAILFASSRLHREVKKFEKMNYKTKNKAYLNR